MAEPFAKFRGRRNILESNIDFCLLLGKTPRPQPVDKYAQPVRVAGFFVNPLDVNFQERPSTVLDLSSAKQETQFSARVGPGNIRADSPHLPAYGTRAPSML